MIQDSKEPHKDSEDCITKTLSNQSHRAVSAQVMVDVSGGIPLKIRKQILQMNSTDYSYVLMIQDSKEPETQKTV